MTKGAVQGLPVTLSASAGDRALPEDFEVRGEVYIKLSDFVKVGDLLSSGSSKRAHTGVVYEILCPDQHN
jgi:NAD-dependent DNA ligase